MLRKASQAWRDGSAGKVQAQGPPRSELQLLHESGWRRVVVLCICEPSTGKVEMMSQSLEVTDLSS